MTIRLTSARKAVLELLEKANAHLSAQQIHEQLKTRLPSLSLSTVYRSLDYLVAHHLISISDMGVGTPVYEILTDQPHHHLVCEKCNQTLHLDPAEVANFLNAVADKTDYKITTNHLVLFGICKDCQGQEP